MYKLTIEFKTIEELAAFAASQSSHAGKLPERTIGASAVLAAGYGQDEVKVETPKAAAPRSKKPVEVKETVEIPPVIVTPVQAAPVQAPAAPSVGKDALVAQATVLVGKLKASGIAESQIMPTINGAFNAAGIPVGQKISALDELSLVKFMPIFEAAVNSIISGTAHSFI